MKDYDHKAIEKKWQKQWSTDNLYKSENTIDGKENHYVLVEFPYPSGNLHVGHWYAFGVTDIYARYQQMNGKNVLFPIGFDAFGLPAENAAIKHGVNPRLWTEENMEAMRSQLASMGGMFDWSREIATCHPDYYKWTQSLFLQLHTAGLVEKRATTVNWDPVDKTVLANEQVLSDGTAERSGAVVEQKEMNQWTIGITKYADRLIDDLDELDWPQAIKDSQKNWIGRSEGAELSFAVQDSERTIDVFTTRPDTLFGVTYMVIAPEHQLVQSFLNEKLVTNVDAVKEYIEKTARKSERDRLIGEKEKTGIQLEGLFAINPANNEKVPVFIADYVLAGYGTGAIMAVPAHDERDYSFAEKFGLEMREVVTEDLLINSEQFNGLTTQEAKQKITKHVGGTMTNTYKLRDWIVSRQRYWGCPIPFIHCESCGAVPVPEDQLPVELPDVEDYLPNSEGKSPLSKVEDWVNVSCPKCNAEAKRETDTLDTFLDSSWYFLRYCDPNNENEFAAKEMLAQWMPVDFYSGGAEHTTMHLLYSRFFHKALFDLGLVPEKEPYRFRLNRGLILGTDGNKMSKSKGNVIDPDTEVAQFGADVVRTYLAFLGPYNEPGNYPWDQNGIVGIRRFMERVASLEEYVKEETPQEVLRLLHQTIKRVGDDVARLKLNTGISHIMILLNAIMKQGIAKQEAESFMKLLAPYAPHLAEQLWHDFGNQLSVHKELWPAYDESLLVSDEITLAIQINGKVRDEITVAKTIEKDDLEAQVMAREVVQKWLDSNEVKKFIYVPNKLVSIVV